MILCDVGHLTLFGAPFKIVQLTAWRKLYMFLKNVLQQSSSSPWQIKKNNYKCDTAFWCVRRFAFITIITHVVASLRKQRDEQIFMQKGILRFRRVASAARGNI